MKYIRYLLLLTCFLIIVSILCSCWNYREIESLSIVTGFAVDTENGKYIVSYEIVNIIGGKNAITSTKLISAEGSTIFEAFRNTIKTIGKKLYTSHAKIIVLSKEIAEEGLIPMLDWINRDNQPRYTLSFLVSREKSAREILAQKPATMDILSYELDDMLKWEQKLSNALDVEMWQFTGTMAGAGNAATLPTVGLISDNGRIMPEISGTGVFKGDRLVGLLDGEETKMMMFVKDKVKGGLLTDKEYKDSSQTNISLEILKNKSKLKPKINNGKLVMEITTNTNVTIGENGGMENYIDEPGRTKLKADFEAILEGKIKELVKKVQRQYGSDIFGFGKTVKVAMPDVWRQIESNWDQMYKNMDVEVHSTINIKNSALETKPLQVGEY